MHMADALLSPAVAATMYAASGTTVGLSVKKLTKDENTQKLAEYENGNAAPSKRPAQKNTIRNSIGRKAARDANRGIRESNGILPMQSFMRYAPGNVRMGFGSTKTAGRR